VAHDVVHQGYTVIPAGTRVSGRVAEVVPPRQIGGQTSLTLRFDELRLADGTSVPVTASLLATGKRQTKKDAATIGGAAAGGAVLGRVLSDKHKGRATVLGGIVGGAIGTAVAARNAAEPVVIAAGTVTPVVLDAPVEIAVRAGARREYLAER
jgi:hypothetical protein